MNALLWLTSCESSRAPSLTELQSLHTTLCKDNVSGTVVLWLPLWIYLRVILCLYFLQRGCFMFTFTCTLPQMSHLLKIFFT